MLHTSGAFKKTYPAEATGTVVRIGIVSIPVQVELDLTVPNVQVRAVAAIRTMHGASHLPNLILIHSTGFSACEVNPELHIGFYP